MNMRIIQRTMIGFLGGLFLFASSTTVVLGADATTANNWNGSKPKYVFMFIGDGVGLQQVSAAEAVLASKDQVKAPGIVKLSFSRFPAQGLSTTYSANSFITDSAPAGTSLATGYKTDNGVVGVDPAKTHKFTTIAEQAKKDGLKVGIISTVSLNHATPASYYAHMPSRGSYYEIGQQLIASGFDFFGGGGLHKYNAKDANGTPRKSLYELAAENGFHVLRDRDSILSFKADGKPVLAVNPVLDPENAMPYDIDRTDKELSLAEFVEKGIEVINNDKGFFLMVEGGKIDWACHANDAATSIQDTFAFDQAIQVALEFAKKHPNETLIVVTGDHETGGLGLGFAGTEYASFFDKIGHQNLSYQAFDKKIEALRKAKGNSATLEDIKGDITKDFGLIFVGTNDFDTLVKEAEKNPEAKKRLGMTVTPAEFEMIEKAFALSMQEPTKTKPGTQEFLLYGEYNPLSVQLTHLLNNKAGIGWTSYAHTGIPVPVFATGLGSDLFQGYYDNTDIAKKMFNIMGLELPAPTTYSSAM